MSISSNLALNDTQQRVLKLLGENYNPEVVSGAVGVSVSYISQLLSDPHFANAVAELRVAKLAGHAERDSLYDKMEDKLAKALDNCIPFMTRPMEIVRALKEINSLKRRSNSTPENIGAQQTVVNLTIPTIVTQQFVTNINNQVIKTGDQNLVTVQSQSLPELMKRFKQAQAQGNKNALTAPNLPS